MKLRVLTKFLILIGIIEIVFSLIWFNKYYDLSQAVLYISGGILIFVSSGIFESIKRNQDRISKSENDILELQRVVTEHEKRLN